MALEHEGLVGEKCKDNGSGPGDGVAPSAGQVGKIIKGQINGVIDQGGQNAEHQIADNIPLFPQNSRNFILA